MEPVSVHHHRRVGRPSIGDYRIILPFRVSEEMHQALKKATGCISTYIRAAILERLSKTSKEIDNE